jgi:hypothetical protein
MGGLLLGNLEKPLNGVIGISFLPYETAFHLGHIHLQGLCYTTDSWLIGKDPREGYWWFYKSEVKLLACIYFAWDIDRVIQTD